MYQYLTLTQTQTWTRTWKRYSGRYHVFYFDPPLVAAIQFLQALLAGRRRRSIGVQWGNRERIRWHPSFSLGQPFCPLHPSLYRVWWGRRSRGIMGKVPWPWFLNSKSLLAYCDISPFGDSVISDSEVSKALWWVEVIEGVNREYFS